MISKKATWTPILMLLIVTITACNKEKRFSKRLLKGGSWTVTSLTIDDSVYTNLPSWQIDDCEIYGDSACTATWVTTESGKTQFAWQFNNKGKQFEISRQYSEQTSFEDLKAIEQCYSLSGQYHVLKHKKKILELKSINTAVHGSSEIRMTVEVLE